MLHNECASSKLNLNSSKLEGLKVADSVGFFFLGLKSIQAVQTYPNVKLVGVTCGKKCLNHLEVHLMFRVPHSRSKGDQAQLPALQASESRIEGTHSMSWFRCLFDLMYYIMNIYIYINALCMCHVCLNNWAWLSRFGIFRNRPKLHKDQDPQLAEHSRTSACVVGPAWMLGNSFDWFQRGLALQLNNVGRYCWYYTYIMT